MYSCKGFWSQFTYILSSIGALYANVLETNTGESFPAKLFWDISINACEIKHIYIDLYMEKKSLGNL